MSLFVCAKCGCIENTATCSFWALVNPRAKDYIYDESLKDYKCQPLCSECAKIEYDNDGNIVVTPGEWHGKFKKEYATEEEKRRAGKNGLIT